MGGVVELRNRNERGEMLIQFCVQVQETKTLLTNYPQEDFIRVYFPNARNKYSKKSDFIVIDRIFLNNIKRVAEYLKATFVYNS